MKTQTEQFRELFSELLKAGLIKEFEEQGRDLMKEQERYPHPSRAKIIQTWMDEADKHGFFQVLPEQIN